MDEEIIIGVNKPQTEKQNGKRNSKNPKNNKKKSKNKSLNKSKNNKNGGKIKIIFVFIILIILIILILVSGVFNIKTIEVIGNQKISSDKIISLSSLELYTNIFNFNKNEIKEKIKENAYIEKVEVSRKIPNTVEIKVEERIPRYMLQFADSYVYINNQGYMLEISNEKENIPILIGFTTDLSNIKAGNRINIQDLKKMDMVIKIFEAARSNELGNFVTKIDISNEKNYTIILENEGKKVYLGDCSDLNTRILYLKSILEASSGKRGEIFLNVDLNSENPYFRPSSE